MKIGNIDDFLLGVALERKIKHWKRMANNSYLPRRRHSVRSNKIIMKG